MEQNKTNTNRTHSIVNKNVGNHFECAAKIVNSWPNWKQELAGVRTIDRVNTMDNYHIKKR